MLLIPLGVEFFLQVVETPVVEVIDLAHAPAQEFGRFPDAHSRKVKLEHEPAIAGKIFDGRHKLVVYHGQEVGELYDLQEDPSEFYSLWDDPGRKATKYELMRTCFGEAMIGVEGGQSLVGGY